MIGRALARAGRLRTALLGVAALCSACGTPGGLTPAGTPSGAAPLPPSAARTAVEPLAPAVSFEIYLPTALRTDLPVSASLRAASVPGDRDGIGDPVLAIEVSVVAGGKPAVMIAEGSAGCCPDYGAPVPAKSVVVRTAPAEVRGEMLVSRSANDGPTLRYLETSARGAQTTVVFHGSTFGPYGTEEALLDLARSMRSLGRATPTGVGLVYYSTHISHSPTGHRISIAVRSGVVPEAARLVGDDGRVIASAPFAPPSSYECLKAAAAVAPLPVSQSDLAEVQRGPFRVEVRAFGTWFRTQLVASNCSSIE